ncbi:TPA: hypothetical protein ACGOYV_000599 [Streptococcus suis]
MKKIRKYLVIIIFCCIFPILSACASPESMLEFLAGKERSVSEEGIYIDAFESFFHAKPSLQIYEHTPAGLLNGSESTSYEVVIGDELANNPIFNVGEASWTPESTIDLPDPYAHDGVAFENARKFVFDDVISHPLWSIGAEVFNNEWIQTNLVKEPYKIIALDNKTIRKKDLNLWPFVTLDLDSFDNTAYQNVSRIHELVTLELDKESGYLTYKIDENDREELVNLFRNLFSEGYVGKQDEENSIFNQIGFVIDTDFTTEELENGANNTDVVGRFVNLDALPEGMVLYLYDSHFNLITYGLDDTEQ